MSDIPANFDLQEQVARIDRAQAETEKFVAEQRKLIAKSMKLDRERFWFPWLQVLAIIGAILSSAGIAAIVARLIR